MGTSLDGLMALLVVQLRIKNFSLSLSLSAHAHLSQHHVHICTLFVSFAVFLIYYFNCISFAIRLSDRKVVIKLID